MLKKFEVNFFILLSKKRNTLLFLHFLQNPSQKTYAAQLEAQLGLSKKSVLDALGDLEAEGILSSGQLGRMKTYSLNKQNPLVKHSKTLLTLSSLQPCLEKIKTANVKAYLFGSAARGEDDEKSDIDIIFIGDVRSSEIAGIFRGMPKAKPLVFSHLEYSSLYRKDRPFYDSIEKDKIRLI